LYGVSVLSKANGKIVAVIPARYASTRFTGKPLVDLCGKPMVQHVYERTIKSKLVNHVLVATDDKRIEEVEKSFGGDVMMTPTNIKSGSDRIAFVANKLDDASIIVNVQGDEPLIEPEMIDQAILPLMKEVKYNVSTLVKKISKAEELASPNIVKVVLDTDMCGIYFSRSPIPHLRDFPNIHDWILHHTFYKHIGLYVYRKEFLKVYVSWKESVLEKAEKLEQLRIIENGEKIKVAITKFDSIPIDTPEDAELVRNILQNK
jgi:3-deoxy-manno-octulosonate cytidylyltransferase (CMP-KDO synthetase)